MCDDPVAVHRPPRECGQQEHVELPARLVDLHPAASLIAPRAPARSRAWQPVDAPRPVPREVLTVGHHDGAAKRSGVKKIVLVSAMAADEQSSNRYYRTKGQAETLVRASGLD